MRKFLLSLIFACFLYADVNYLELGISAYKKGLYSLSNQQLEKFIKNNPKSPYLDYAYLLYSRNLINLGKFKESQEKLVFLVENFPDSQYIKTAYTYLILVTLKLSEKNDDFLNQTLSYYREYKKRYDTDSFLENQICSFALTQAIELFKKGEFCSAGKFLNYICTNFPHTEYSDFGNYYLGLIYYQKNEFKRAKEYFLNVEMKKEDILPDLYLKLGDCFLNLKDYENAYNLYEKIITRWPETENANWARFQLAFIMKRKGKIKEAEKILSNIKTFDKDLNIKILKALSDLYSLEGNWKKAEEILLQLFHNFPEEQNAENYVKLGFTNFNMKNYQDAIKHFQKALEMKPSEEMKQKIYFGLGYTLYLNGDIDKAFDLWEKIEKSYPESDFLPEIYFIKGKKYYELKNFSESKIYLENLITNYEKSPYLTQTIPLLVEIYIEENDIEKAEKLCKKYLNNNDELKFFYGKILYIKKEYRKAKEIFEKTELKNPLLKVEILYYLSQIYLYLGETEKSKEKLLEIITYYPQFKKFTDMAEKELKKFEK